MSTPTPTASALPSAMKQRMQALQEEQNQQTPPSTPPSQDPPQGEQTPTTQENQQTPPAGGDGNNEPKGEAVTLTREEYNELKANAGRVATLQGREEIARLELEEARQRLTELENSNKGSPAAPAAPASPAIDVSGIQFTDEENEAYADTRPFIEKVVDLRVAEQLNRLLPELRSAIDEAKQAAQGAVGEVAKTNQRTFHQSLVARVPNLQKIIRHPQWEAFLDQQEQFSGFTYEQLISHNVAAQNLDRTAKIYETFEREYMKPAQGTAGYAGASPTGGAEPSGQPQQVQKFKLSDRKKASEDYRKGRITYEQLQQITKKFEQAEKSGNVDYNS